MSMKYIRDYYKVPAKRGGRVIYKPQNKQGTIKSSSGAYLLIRLDGENRNRVFHPAWGIEYL